MKQYLDEERWGKIREMVESGMTLRETSERSGVAYSTIQNRAMKGCWGSGKGSKQERGREVRLIKERRKRLEEHLAVEEAVVAREVGETIERVWELEKKAKGVLLRDSELVK